ncbi:unnamed protein product [marine sediment metagenome]|uniref:Uncharacterized protein n=1 Tax=marine sediment metagenome TaxID=412755 RepID=X1BZZ7_9ZZZZ
MENKIKQRIETNVPTFADYRNSSNHVKIELTRFDDGNTIFSLESHEISVSCQLNDDWLIGALKHIVKKVEDPNYHMKNTHNEIMED